jgi:Type II secretion system (T2SS), protein E, N-terminal domain
MPSRLSSLLVRDGLVGVRRMEKAFQRQVIYGGSLDTILLELGMVPEERLCQYLALASGLPPASRAELELIDPAAVALLPLEAAQSYRAVPLVLEGDAVRMAVCSPIDLAALEDLADQVDRPLRPLLVPEYRWHLMMARAYGASVPQRYAALAAQIEKEPAPTPVGRARTVIVENEPERDTIVVAAPLLPATPVAVGGEETARARANRVTEDVLPVPRSARAGGRPPSNSESPRPAGRLPSNSEENDLTDPGPADPFGMERAAEQAASEHGGAAVRPAVHGDTPKSKRRRGGATLIGVSPVRALSELGPQSDLFNETDLSPASGIPTHVRGELGDDDVTPPPRRHGDSGRRMTEVQFPVVSVATPPGTLVAVEREAAQAAQATRTGEGEDAGAAPLPPTPATPARSRTAPMPALTGASEGSGGHAASEASAAPAETRVVTRQGTAPPERPSAPQVTAPATASEPAKEAEPATARYLQTIPPPMRHSPYLQAPRAIAASERPSTEPSDEQQAPEATAPLERADAERPSAPRIAAPVGEAPVEPRTATRMGTAPPLAPRVALPLRSGAASQPAPHVEVALDSLRSEPSFTPAVPAALTPNAGPISQRDARELLVHAEHRDDVFLALLRAVRHVAQWAGLLTIQGGVAIGRLALAHPELDTEQISTVLIPLDAPSPIRTAVTSKRLYVGPLAKGDPAVDSMFLRLGGVRPPSLAVLPLVLRERVVAMVVAHRADRDITFGDVAELLPLAALATEAIGRLILRSKGDTGKTAAPSPRAPTTPPQDASFGARARTEPPPSSAAQHRAPTARAERTPAERKSDPGDPDPEPAPAPAAARTTSRPRPVLEILADDPDDLDEAGQVALVVMPEDEGSMPSDWRGHSAEGTRQRGGYRQEPGPQRTDEPWGVRSQYGENPRWTGAIKAQVPPSQPAPPVQAPRPTSTSKSAAAPPPLRLASPSQASPVRPRPAGSSVPQRPRAIYPSAPPSLPPPSSATSSGASPMTLSPEVLLELIEERGAEAEAAIDEAVARAGEVLPLVDERFPGALVASRYETTGRPLRAAQYSGLLELVTRMGAAAAAQVSAMLLGKLDASSREVRFYAMVCLLELRPPGAIAALVERLFDPDFGVRALAVTALQGYPPRELEAGFRRLRQALHSGDAGKVAAAASAVAELGDRDALIDLISAMGRGERFAESTRRALMSLTVQDFGTSDRKWQRWWEDHRRRHRIEWLIDGLAHKESELRTAAISNLRRLTGESFGYEADAAKRDRDIAHRRWLTWWNEAGRLRFVAQENERHRPTALLPLRHDPRRDDD